MGNYTEFFENKKGEFFMRNFRLWGLIVFCCLFAGFAAPGAEAQNRRAVLDRGNVWVTGIPGFGENRFPALFGEYRLELPAGNASPGAAEGAGEQRCRIWLSGERLPFAGESWQPRPGIAGVSAVQRREGEVLLAGFFFSGGANLGAWTAVFLFPQGIAAAGLDDAGADALMGRWLNRFLYFLSLIKTPADVSLPAVIAF
jgi:hypothetical protein